MKLITELANIVRLNQDPPNVVIEKTHGGIAVAQQKKLKNQYDGIQGSTNTDTILP